MSETTGELMTKQEKRMEENTKLYISSASDSFIVWNGILKSCLT